MIKTTTTGITTAMGTTSQWYSAGLGEHAVALNTVGYTGKFDGVKMTRNEYLNKFVNTDKLSFSLEQTKTDNGDFSEAFILTRSEYVDDIPKPKGGIIKCPHCGERTVRIFDNLPLSYEPYGDTENRYSLDSEIYANAKCDTCDKTFTLTGQISWCQPNKIK